MVEPYSISHDAVDPVGYTIEVNGKKLGLATDLGHAGKLVPLKLSGSDLLMIESNHDPKMLRESNRPARLQHRILGRRGHLSNDMAADLMTAALAQHTKHVVLVHLSSDCNCPKIVEDTFLRRLKELGREDINIAISMQDHLTETIIID